ncbi:MAG: peptidoglycan DD-metalloendopeptidase family protein [Oscillospiraceae bacterium]|nr:peptidoglycan DD-metalloendopeptidase family protein [Oscillospiraceae bacterium]
MTVRMLWEMSLGGGAAALLAYGAAFVLRRLGAPSRLVCLLWMVVCFRLVCPLSVAVQAPRGCTPPAQQMQARLHQLEWSPVEVMPLAEEEGGGEKALAAVYAAGLLAFGGRGLAGYCRLKKRVALAYKTPEGWYTGSGVETPFVLGVLCPRVYLPPWLGQEQRRWVLAHEEAHLKWKDNWTRPFFYLAACLHWFNPLAWLAYRSFVKATEAACDEAVLAREGAAAKGEYTRCLLALAEKHTAPVGVLAFGQKPLKSRAAHILGWQRPGKGVLGLALAVTLAAAGAGMVSIEAAGPQPQVLNNTFATGAEKPAAPEELAAEKNETAEKEWLWPVPGYNRVTHWMDEEHKGTDIAAEKGTEILAMAEGVVAAAGYDALGQSGHGYLVLLDHGGFYTLYAHCDSVAVEKGQTVAAGQVIASVGSTGLSTGPHCHVEIRDGEGNWLSLKELAKEPGK